MHDLSIAAVLGIIISKEEKKSGYNKEKPSIGNKSVPIKIYILYY